MKEGWEGTSATLFEFRFRIQYRRLLIEANALLPYDAPLAFPDLVVVELKISICPIENAALLPYDAPLAFPDLVEVEVNISSCPIEKSALPP